MRYDGVMSETTIPGDLLTTAMGVMPHRDVDRALELALSMDVPYWPQLPHLSYREDMYVQASERFPGAVVDEQARTLRFSMERFAEEIDECLAHFDDPSWFDVSPEYSAVYQRFLELDLSDRLATRGQLEGPVSFGFNVCDDNDRPIIMDDTVRPFLMEFMAKRINAQLARLRQQNPRAFMFVDEPGLQFLWSALAGYNDQMARRDMAEFFAMIDRPRGVHLCGNPDWNFLLDLDLDVLSLDIYSNAEVFVGSAPAIRRFLERGSTIVWGILPTNTEPFEKENIDSLEARLLEVWSVLESRGVDRELILDRGMLSPATCCLVNADGVVTVERAFEQTRALSRRLRQRFGIDDRPTRLEAAGS